VGGLPPHLNSLEAIDAFRPEPLRARRPVSGNYGLVTGMKPDGVVAVTVGLAALVSGAAGGVVVVIVCSLAWGATGPTTCSGWAELMTSPKITPSAPMATTALTPRTADNNLTFFCCEFTLTTPFGSGSSATLRRGVALDGLGASWLPRSPLQDT
jgi:hypothetical protein